jgi:hypothetical protein
MSFNMNRFTLACACAALLCGIANLAHANSYNLGFDPDEDYPAGAINAGDPLSVVTSVYKPLYGIEILEPNNGFVISRMGECCGGERFLNVGFAPVGKLHWFVNAAPGYYFPAGSTISVDWADFAGGPAALKAFAGTISTDPAIATVANANDPNGFGGKIGSVVSQPAQFPTLTLTLTQDARSFTVHQAAITPPFTDDTYVTGFLNGENLAGNAAINGIRLTVVPEPATVGLGVFAALVSLAGVRRRSA